MEASNQGLLGGDNQLKDGIVVPKESISRSKALCQFCSLSIPFSLTRFIGVGTEFMGAVFLSQLGQEYLAASGLITVSQNMLLTAFCGALYATGDLASDENGKGNAKNVGKVLNSSYLLAAATGMASTAVLIFAAPILKSVGQPERASEITQEYFRSFSVGIPVLLLSVSSQQIAYVMEKQRVVLGINIFRRIIYIGLAYALIGGNFGMPRWGARGYGIAAAVSTCVDQLLFMAYFKFNRELADKYGLFKSNLKESLSFMKALLSRSTMIGLNTLNEFLSGFVITIFMGLMGKESLAAIEVINQYTNLLNIPVLSSSQSSAILVAREKGKDKSNAVRIGTVAIVSSLLIPAFAVPFFLGIPNLLSSLFIHSDEGDTKHIKDISAALFKVSSATLVANTVRNVSSGGLRGLEDYKYALGTNVAAISLLGLVLGYLLAFTLDMGPIGAALGAMIGMFIAALLIAVRWGYVSNRFLKPADEDLSRAVGRTSSVFPHVGRGGLSQGPDIENNGCAAACLAVQR